MRFYDRIQLDPAAIRRKIDATSNQHEIRMWKLASVVRSALIVAFAVLFISVMSALFGTQNSPMAVSLFCILLAVRFVGYGYNIKDALFNMFIIFAILLVVPPVAFEAGILGKLILYILSLLVMMVMACQKPQMGNGGLYTFSFVFLCENPVYGEVFMNRMWMTLAGFAICGWVMYHNHKDQDKDVRFSALMKKISLKEKLFQWQLRLALGVGLLLAIFSYFGAGKFMWIGFACGSLLSDYNVENNIREKFRDRLVGAVVGSFAFYILYMMVPARFYPWFGPVGGFCLGMCTEYKHKTMLNCFGALMMAVSLYGLKDAVFIRISNTLLGILFALIFYYLYDHFLMKGLLKAKNDPIARSFTD